MNESDALDKIRTQATSMQDAITMILAYCSDMANHNGLLLSVSKFDAAAEMIIALRGTVPDTAVSTWHSTAVKPETLVSMNAGRRSLIVWKRSGTRVFHVLYKEQSGQVLNHADGLGYAHLTDFDFWCIPPRGGDEEEARP